ncbi:hypothetical protein [Shimia sediminis]|uniref:hypothetical protein n=1 Tax=Shimia sediminis TaxID=2497945 RepID=UPI000F8E7DE6|nr:hypothetical protein [Shimia sediminis]
MGLSAIFIHRAKHARAMGVIKGRSDPALGQAIQRRLEAGKEDLQVFKTDIERAWRWGAFRSTPDQTSTNLTATVSRRRKASLSA